MAEIFISYTSSDRDWAHWIAQELKALGHVPRVHEWEIKAGDDIYRWMEQRHDAADHVLCVISDEYLKAPYSTLERNAALWQAAAKRPGFVLLVAVKPCKLPTLSDHILRCELFGIAEETARVRFREFMQRRDAPEAVAFPGTVFAVSNVPIRVPVHFLGREDTLAAIEAGLKRYEGRVAITALHGLRGVGKTTIAAAYAERHRGDYRATWWIRAQTDDGLRADLIGLGVRLGWVAADEKEGPALAAVMDRLRHEGEGILLIYDNAVDADVLKPYLPPGGHTQVLVTSNARTWRGVAEPVEIRLWPKEIGADFLIARTGRAAEREAALTLSEVLGGLPLAHEQAAAYCERLGVSLADYCKRFDAAPVRMLGSERDAPIEYHDRLTVAKTFALAIDEVAKLHPAAEPLIVHAALLAPEPIPLFLFAEAREKFGEPLATALADDGLDEAVAALRAFALVDRETIADERDPTITTDTIRLHRLVRQVAAARVERTARDAVQRALIEAVAAVYPEDIWRDPHTWARVRRLDMHVLALVGSEAVPHGAEKWSADLLIHAGEYRQGALAAHAQAKPLFERALAICEKTFGSEHPNTARCLNNLASLLRNEADFAGARPLYERALAIYEKALGSEHPATATSLDGLAELLQTLGDLAAARPLYERALAIEEKEVGHPATATSLSGLALLLQAQGDLAAARPLYERALAIEEKEVGPEHPATARSLIRLANLLRTQGDLAAARPLCERALAICEKVLGPEHPETARSVSHLAALLKDEGDLAAARPLYERALAIDEKALGLDHPKTAGTLNDLAELLHTQGDLAAARPLYERALASFEKALGPEHVWTAHILNSLGHVLQAQGDLAAARSLFERALAIYEKVLGSEHQNTNRVCRNLATLLVAAGEHSEALTLGKTALAAHDKALGPNHAWTKDAARVTADALDALGYGEEAKALRTRYGLENSVA
jgi:tetratricopeptide (TPR) repeat protein